MKRLFYIGLLAALGCRKNAAPMDTATLIGSDPRTGACEGGTFIKIDGHPNPNDPENGYYDVNTWPRSFSPDGSNYPIKVKINWKVDSKCFGNYVDISRMEVVN